MPRTPKPRTLSAKRFGPRARKLLRTDEQIKALYEKRDEIEAKLLEKARAGDRIPLGNGKFAVLTDNFTDKDGKAINKCYRAHGISRFQFKVIVTQP